MNARRALVIGSKGQDGSYLTELLDEKGYRVTGVDSSGAVSPTSRGCIATVDMRHESEVLDLIAGIRPDEIYYLAAHHHSSEAGGSDPHELLQASFDINTLALNHVLQAGRKGASGCRIFYAASSRIFGSPETSVQNENSRFNPECAYGISKAAGVLICRYYRKEYGVRCSTGILYNHESPRRRTGYISKNIVSAAVAIKQGRRSDLVVGNLDARVDWGFAPDYVSAMWSILQLDLADDFVIASGSVHSVRDFVRIAFDALGLEWSRFVREDPQVLAGGRPSGVLQGDTRKLECATGWRPRVSFEEMVRIMVEAEIACTQVAAALNN
jgi:GDPmannose 4,6-dehydratase